jgi:hypothetical protein
MKTKKDQIFPQQLIKGKFNRLLIWKLMSLMDSRAAAPGIHELTGSWP